MIEGQRLAQQCLDYFGFIVWGSNRKLNKNDLVTIKFRGGDFIGKGIIIDEASGQDYINQCNLINEPQRDWAVVNYLYKVIAE